MTLIVEPDDGIAPVVEAINHARTSIDIGSSPPPEGEPP